MSQFNDVERERGLEKRPNRTPHPRGGLRLLLGTAASLLAACVSSQTVEAPVAPPNETPAQTSGAKSLFCTEVSLDKGTVYQSKPWGDPIYTVVSGDRIRMTAHGNSPTATGVWTIPDHVTGYRDSIGLFEYPVSNFTSVIYIPQNHTGDQVYPVEARISDVVSADGYTYTTGCPPVWLHVIAVP